MPDVDVAQVEADLKPVLDAEEALYGYAMALSPLVGAIALAGASLTIVRSLSAVWWVQLIIMVIIAGGGAWIFWRFWRIFRWLGEIRRSDRVRRAVVAEHDRLVKLELAEEAVEEAKKHTFQSTISVFAVQLPCNDVRTVSIDRDSFLVVNIDGDFTMEETRYAAEHIKGIMAESGVKPAGIITLGSGFGVSSLSRKQLQELLDRSEDE